MTHPKDDDQHPALPRHTTDAEIGDAMTKQVALLRAHKGGVSPDAWQEGWREGVEAAATYVASMDSSMDSTFELYHTIHIASDQCASVAENREQALKILAEIAAAIRTLAEKGPTDD